jgi:phosphoribosylanthranilate isomerase
MTFIKFCGMTREQDIHAACVLGIEALGFVLWPQSPRHVGPRRVAQLVKEMAPNVTPVGVLVTPSADEVNAALDAGVRMVQVHGCSNTGSTGTRDRGALDNLIWATSVEADLSALPGDVTVLLDALDPIRHGGTGRTVDWSRAAVIAGTRRVILAGGLTPANVGEAIRTVRPFGVDVSSGIELQPGIKNAHAMAAFVAAAREAYHS